MKHFYLSIWLFSALFLLFVSINSYSQNFQFQWAHAITGTHWLGAGPITTDNRGNLYVTGSFQGTVDFDPGNANATITTDTVFGSDKRFIAKYDPDGKFLFVQKFEAGIQDIVIDNNNIIVITGTFSDTVDFDLGLGSAELISAGYSDIFVAKYDSLGNYIHAFSIEGIGIDMVEAIAIDVNDYVYITGEFSNTADFDPGPGTLTLESSAQADAFLAKYTYNGDLSFAFNLEGASNSNSNSDGQDVVIDQQGNVILGGVFLHTIDLDPGTGTNLFTSVDVDGFIAKFDPSGNHLSGHTYDGSVFFVDLDGEDNLYVTGRMTDSMDVDQGPGFSMLYSEDNFDVWIAKYDAQSNYLHAKAFESNELYIPTGLAVNHLNNVYLTGRYKDTLNLNPGGLNGVFYSQGNNDGFIGKFDPSGNFLFGASFGSIASDEIFDLALDRQGGVWICGFFDGTVGFDPEVPTNNLSSPNGKSIFIAKYLDDVTTDVSEPLEIPLDVNIYSANKNAYIDFSAVNHVDAQIKVINLLGQEIALTKHTSNDLLKLNLPDVSSQIYLVIVSNDGKTITKKIWVQ